MRTVTPSSVRRFAGVAADPQTYRNLAYLTLAFPMGLAYFAALVAGGTAGLATIPLAVGVPILAAVIATTFVFGLVEARLANDLLGADVEYRLPRLRDETALEFAARVALDPGTYLALVYLLSKFAIGVAAFVALTIAGALSAGLVAAPLLYDRPGFGYQVGATTIDTLPQAAAAVPVGIVLAVASLHLLNVGAAVVREYTEAMLGAAGPGSRSPTPSR